MSVNTVAINRDFVVPETVDILYNSRIFRLRLEEMYKRQDYIEKAKKLSQKLRQNALERELFSREVQLFKKNISSDNFLYRILGLSSKAASAEEIKACWRKQVIKWHPDKALEYNKKTCEKVLKLLNLAHEILSDRDKKNLYDRYGKQWLSRCGYLNEQSLNDI